ncbi:unnamed protein product [Jaminaea pallidilutea]
MPPTRRLHGTGGGRRRLDLVPLQSRDHGTGSDADENDVLMVPSDARRRLAASKTVGAFDKLRKAEAQRAKEAQAKAEQQRQRDAEEAQRRDEQRKKRRLQAASAAIKTEPRDDVIEIDGDSAVERVPVTEPGSLEPQQEEPPQPQVISIKDESDDEDVKPVITGTGHAVARSSAHQSSRPAASQAPQAAKAVEVPQAAPASSAPRTPSPVPVNASQHNQNAPLSAIDRLQPSTPDSEQPLLATKEKEKTDTAPGQTVTQDREATSDQAGPWPVPTREELPWPEPFERLEDIFKALNTVYSFCSARKHLATTFETLRGSVEALIKRELEVHHIAQLKSLLPDLISFAYVDSDAIDVTLDSAGSDAKQKALARRADQDDAFEEAARTIATQDSWSDFSGLTGPETRSAAETLPSVSSLQEASKTAAAPQERDEYVLLFEFNDGTLQGAKATARGQRRAGMRRGPNRQGPPKPGQRDIHALPSATSMKRLIDKRNAKFESAVCELLAACHAKGEDAVELLIAAAHDHVPLDPATAERPVGETPRKRRIRLDYLMNHPDERPEMNEVIEDFEGQKWWCDQVVPGGRRTIPGREARYDGLTFALSQELVNALWSTRKIEEFFLHQAEALNALDEGLNVIVSTSTSSGKSLIYQIPVIRALEEHPGATAMFIFPTKALAQDQRRSLEDLIQAHETLNELEVMVATYDGDTDKSLRLDIRERANVIFTNPDMLHQSMLPHEHNWRRFLRELRFVVVDELHTYNGLFGAHVSLIMRRLRRICNALGNRHIQFVSCSATVANPREHMQTLFGITDVEVVTEDGSPCGKKEWLIWNPPLIDDKDPKQGRVSAYAEVSKIFRHLVERGVRTIIFTKVRRTCEIVISQVRKDLLLDNRHDIVDKVMSYRSGYSAVDRRKIEQDMWQGSLLGIVATSALELGIDIGSLDAVIMLGFPYSISSLRQQSGRAGRRLKDSLTVLCCDPFPMDQHYARFPEDVFNQPESALTVDLSNDFVLEAHLQCAAEEMPIHPKDDEVYFGDHLSVLCKNRLVRDDDGFYHCRNELRPNPAREVAIRGARQVTYSYIDATPGRRGGPQIMEEVEIDRAIFEAFEGAVFMHQGLSYICKEISHDTRIAKMMQADVNFHTRPRDHTDTDAVETYRIRALKGTTSRAYFGKVTITTHVWGYFKVDRRANILDAVDVDCPPFVRHTRGFWIDVPMWIIHLLTEHGINAAAAIHAAEHALLSLTPMFVVSMAGDVRTECKIAEREYLKSKATTRKRPARLIFYDMPGQNGGICEKAFEHLDGVMRIAIAVIEACSCVDGCQGCVCASTCAYANQVTSKIGALGILRGLAGLEPFEHPVPQQDEGGHGGSHVPDATQALSHTIEEARPVRIGHAPPRPAMTGGSLDGDAASFSAGRTSASGTLEVEQYEERLPPRLEEDLRRLQTAVDAGNPKQGRSLLFEEE